MSCSCLWGEPVIGKDGECHCVNPLDVPTTWPNRTARPVVNHVYITKPDKPEPRAVEEPRTADNTIFGLNPLLVMGAAVVGLYFLSSMGEKEGKS